MLGMSFSTKVWIFQVLIGTSVASLLVTNPCTHNFFYNALYDLESGTVCTSPYVTVQTPFEGSGCDTRGTVKIALASHTEDPNRGALMVDLFFDNPTGFTFDLGDSSTNNGFGGDDGYHDYDAEIHPIDNTSLRIFRNNRRKGAITVANAFTTRLTIFVKDKKIRWVSETRNDFIEGEGLFSLAGESDDVSAGNIPNYDVYLGMNKIIKGKGGGRFGSGLCKVGIRFLPKEESLYDALYDLQHGDVCHSPYITELNPLVGQGCDSQGTLKIALAAATEDPLRRQVLVDLFFDNPSGWTFNLGDSWSNDGYGGDNGHTEYDAEVHAYGVRNHGVRIYRGDKLPGRRKTIPGSITTRLTLVVKDHGIQWITERAIGYIWGTGLFALNGQSDYDLYLGLNKIIYNFDKTGSGLCRAGIKFLPDVGGWDGTPSFHNPKEAYDTQLETDALNWIEAVLEEELAPTKPIGENNFKELFDDGIKLDQLINKLSPGKISHINTEDSKFKNMENISNFLEAALDLGTPAKDLFTTVDLMEGDNIPKVLNGIKALARRAEVLSLTVHVWGHTE